MAKLLSDLLPRILGHVPQCSEPLAEQHLADATVRFFDDSSVYAVDLTPINLVADQALYTLTPPTGYYAKHVRLAHMQGQPMFLASEDQFDTEWGEISRRIEISWNDSASSDFSSIPATDWRAGVSALPGALFQPDPTQIRLVGIPTTALTGALTLNVVVVPTMDVTAIPDWIYDRYYPAIVDATLATLKMIRNKPWSDPNDAAVREGMYMEKMGQAKSMALRSHKRNDKTTRRVRACP